MLDNSISRHKCISQVHHTYTFPCCIRVCSANQLRVRVLDRIYTALNPVGTTAPVTLGKLECGPMPNVMVALPNIVGALCSTPQSLADAHYLTAVQERCQDAKAVEISSGAPNW